MFFLFDLRIIIYLDWKQDYYYYLFFYKVKAFLQCVTFSPYKAVWLAIVCDMCYVN